MYGTYFLMKHSKHGKKEWMSLQYAHGFIAVYSAIYVGQMLLCIGLIQFMHANGYLLITDENYVNILPMLNQVEDGH
jgi:hypothetical protein